MLLLIGCVVFAVFVGEAADADTLTIGVYIAAMDSTLASDTTYVENSRDRGCGHVVSAIPGSAVYGRNQVPDHGNVGVLGRGAGHTWFFHHFIHNGCID